MKLSLIVGQGKLLGKEIPITLSPFLIGRDPQCHLRPASPLVSKRHCALVLKEGKAYLRDFDSTNGTQVNNKPVKGEMELHDGDELKIGPVAFSVRLVATHVAAAKPDVLKPVAAAGGEKSKVVAGSSNRGGRMDEDEVADLLLSFGDEAGAGKSTTDSGVAIPAGSTVMDVVPMSSDSDEMKPEDGKDSTTKGTKKQTFDNAATSNAAKAILEKYMRRPRT